MRWHTELIVLLARLLRPILYVELGIRHCETFNAVIPYARRLIGVDTNNECGSYIAPAPNVEFVNSSTLEFAATLRKPILIDMLFIDADHAKISVIEDFRMFFPYVANQGIILFHDTFPGNEKQTRPNLSGTAYKAVETLARVNDEYEMMTIPLSPGLTICRKRKTQVAW